ncbi:MAG: hypothetical protein ACU0B9_14675 [Limimaricola soesokkakensis]|uniref:hypothetical protein n=1 Tax=Limimaricola soesokkakensis TaxID=1343159 RepID=UPI00405935A7
MRDLPAFDGVELLGIGMFGGGQLHHGRETITAPDQLAGQKFRMGGPIQERLLTELCAVPVAAPASKAYELLESGVVDGSLHTSESVVNFRLEDSLTQHTLFPEGFYDATFFVAMNGARWDGLSRADRDAIAAISGEELFARLGCGLRRAEPGRARRAGRGGARDRRGFARADRRRGRGPGRHGRRLVRGRPRSRRRRSRGADGRLPRALRRHQRAVSR